MIFSDMCAATHELLQKIHQQDFNQELSQGVLAEDKFTYYLTQDALYLADYSRTLALAAARLPQSNHVQAFLQFAADAIKAERELHFTHLSHHHIHQLPEQSPICFMYTNYLFKMATTAPVEVAVASLLPCFWIYWQVGSEMAKTKVADNPYQPWIDLYTSAEFGNSVEFAISIVNELGMQASPAIKQQMIAAFFRASQLEWLFWDGAYKLEQWVI